MRPHAPSAADRRARTGSRRLPALAVLVVALVAGLLVPAAPLAPADAATTPTPQCGGAIRKSDGTRWTCTFADDFSGTALDQSLWSSVVTATSGYTLGGECQTNWPTNVSVGDGVLSLTARREAWAFWCQSFDTGTMTDLTGATVSTFQTFAQTRGRYEVRAAMPAGTTPGTQSALWMLPQRPTVAGGWPYTGEIDIAEFFSQYPDRAVPMVHYGASSMAGRTNQACLVDDPTRFHTYVLEWTTKGYTIAYDGKVCLQASWLRAVDGTGRRLTLGKPFDTPFYLNLTQGVGVGANAPTAATTLPATMKVDWVKVWK